MNQVYKIRGIWMTLCLFVFVIGGSLHNASARTLLGRTVSISDSLKYLGHSFVKIKTSEGKVIYIDPFNVNEFADSADVVLITHEHSDHNDLTRVHQKASCTVIRSANAIIGGVYQSFTIGNIKITAVAAYNANHLKSQCVGYVVEFDGIKMYHAGDTGKITEMADLASQDITYALLPMDGIYTMTPEEATQAAAMIHAKHDIPIHTMPPPDTYSTTIVSRFASPNKLVVLPGESIELHRSSIRSVPGNFVKIQSAINDAIDGDTIIVDPGVYHENINFLGKNIVVSSRFIETGDLNFVQSTIIDGSQPIHADTASCVLIVNHEDSTTILQGFTITGGTGTKWKDEHSSGTYREGGGILVAFSSPIIRNNIIINNEAINTSGVTNAGGGGIRAGDGNPQILNNIIAQNKGQYGGSGVVLNWTGAILRNNIFVKNSGGHDDGGGALWVNHDGPAQKIIENNTFADNQLLAVYVWQGPLTIRNSIFWGNNSPQITVRSGGLTVLYSDVQGGYTGQGNINLDPMLIDTNYSLQSGSPCVDAGDSTAVFFDDEDPVSLGNALWPSRGRLRNDIGAYGGPGAARFPNFNLITGVEVLQTLRPSEFRLEQNYPNPFNPSTNIKFNLPFKTFVTLKIFDLVGREVALLANENKQPGSHTIQWNAVNMPSGIYFYKIQAEKYAETKKLVLIK